MARRVITHSRRYRDRVVAVGNPDEWWSPRSVVDVMIDIERQAHTYHVLGPDGRTIRIVLGGNTGGITAPGPDGIDLLGNLPLC